MREAVRDLDRLRTVHRRSIAVTVSGSRSTTVATGHSTFGGALRRDAGVHQDRRHADSDGPARSGPRSAIRALVAFAASSGAQVVAEEVENDATASAMLHLGVGLAQGFMWGNPAAASAWQFWVILARSG